MQIMKIKERKKSVIMNHVVRLMDVLLLLFAESHSPSLELQMQYLLCRSFDKIGRLFVIENQVCNSTHKFRVGFCKVDHRASLSRIRRYL